MSDADDREIKRIFFEAKFWDLGDQITVSLDGSGNVCIMTGGEYPFDSYNHPIDLGMRLTPAQAGELRDWLIDALATNPETP